MASADDDDFENDAATPTFLSSDIESVNSSTEIANTDDGTTRLASAANTTG